MEKKKNHKNLYFLQVKIKTQHVAVYVSIVDCIMKFTLGK